MRRRSSNLLQEEMLKAVVGAKTVAATVFEKERRLRISATWPDGATHSVEIKFSPGTLPEAAKIAANKLNAFSGLAEAVRVEPDVSLDKDVGLRRKERRANKKR